MPAAEPVETAATEQVDDTPDPGSAVLLQLPSNVTLLQIGSASGTSKWLCPAWLVALLSFVAPAAGDILLLRGRSGLNDDVDIDFATVDLDDLRLSADREREADLRLSNLASSRRS